MNTVYEKVNTTPQCRPKKSISEKANGLHVIQDECYVGWSQSGQTGLLVSSVLMPMTWKIQRAMLNIVSALKLFSSSKGRGGLLEELWVRMHRLTEAPPGVCQLCDTGR